MYKFVFLFLTFVFHQVATGQDMWKSVPVERKSLRTDVSDQIIPEVFDAYQLEIQAVRNVLLSLPGEVNDVPVSEAHTIKLPLSDGELYTFVVWESPVTEPGLADKFPTIKTFKGYKKGDKFTTARFTLGPSGFSGMVKAHEGLTFIDRLETESQNTYMVSRDKDYNDPIMSHPSLCGVENHEDVNSETPRPKWGTGKRNNTIELRKFRLALACTGPWGQRRGTVEKAMEDMIDLVNRSNLIFESEIAMRLVLIDNNERLIHLDPNNDPYTNTEQGLQILRQNTTIINQRIGSSNYEIGHVLSICYDVGGVAGGLICTENRGAGVTCFNAVSVNPGTVLVFTHEVGHQITASHTFNNCPGQEGQLSGTGYEPGSGNTIMAYPGACGPSNLGLPRQSYFHGANLEQMLFYTNFPNVNGYTCAEKVDIGNFLPVIDLPYTDGFTIPSSTPFYLNASATDDNEGDNLTYSWEQFDRQTSRPPGDPLGNCPLFISLNPSPSTARYFPNPQRIMSGEFFNRLEYLPNYTRDMTFRFIVRDDNPLGSAAVWEELKFKVDGNSGPFEILEPSEPKIWNFSERVDIEWDVANTDKAPVNCEFVDIFLFTGSRIDFDSEDMIILSERVPNNGKASVIIPAIASSRARIVVKASDNIFFTISRSDSRVLESTEPGFFMNVDKVKKETCLPDNVTYTFSTVGFAGLNDTIKFDIEGLPENITASFSNGNVMPGEETELELDLSGAKGNKEYIFTVKAYVENLDTIFRTLFLTTYGTDIDNMTLFSPAPEASGVDPVQTYTWLRLADAVGYELQVSASPAFDVLLINETLFDTVFNSTLFLPKSTLYFWRVRSFNDCKTGQWTDIQTFHTESFSCFDVKSGPLQVNISSTGRPTVEGTINVLEDTEVSEVSVNNLIGSHSRVSDLTVTLVAPSGKDVLLWNKKCPSALGFNLSLNDKSSLPIRCPLHVGNVHKPEEALSELKGEKTQGIWTIRIEDTEPGAGGRLTNFDLEFCTSVSTSNPFLVVNNTLTALARNTTALTQDFLLCDHPVKSPENLTYILTKIPAKGILTKNSTPLNTGDTFTQQDINDGIISYVHNTSENETDSFDFVVIDGESGWLPVHTFNITIDASSSSDDFESKEASIWIYPNPAQDVLNISTLDEFQTIQLIRIFDLNGNLITQKNWDLKSGTLEVGEFPRGIILLHIYYGDNVITKRVVLQ